MGQMVITAKVHLHRGLHQCHQNLTWCHDPIPKHPLAWSSRITTLRVQLQEKKSLAIVSRRDLAQGIGYLQNCKNGRVRLWAKPFGTNWEWYHTTTGLQGATPTLTWAREGGESEGFTEDRRFQRVWCFSCDAGQGSMLLPQLQLTFMEPRVGTGKLLQEPTDPMTMLVSRTAPPPNYSQWHQTGRIQFTLRILAFHALQYRKVQRGVWDVHRAQILHIHYDILVTFWSWGCFVESSFILQITKISLVNDSLSFKFIFFYLQLW